MACVITEKNKLHAPPTMRSLIASFIIILFVIPVRGQAQVPETNNELYRLVLNDFMQSGMAEQDTGFGVIDSTCQAVFYGGFPDSVNKKYFGFDANNYIDGEVFRRNFVESSAKVEMLPAEAYADKGLTHIPKDQFRKCFSNPKQPQMIVLTEKGFEKFIKLFKTDIYCEFSAPYFINEHSVLIYFNYQDGLDNNFSNVYLLVRKGREWVIASRLRGWGCCLLYTSPSPRDRTRSRMPSSA
jgi:hypothetical protein